MKTLVATLLLMTLSVESPARTIRLATSDILQVHFPEIVELVQQAYALEGHEVEVINLPGARSIAMLKTGELDGELMRFKGLRNTIPNMVRVDVELTTEDIVAIVHQDSDIQSIAQLKGKSMAAVRGVQIIQPLAQRMNSPVTLLSDFETSALMVTSKRVDYMLATHMIAERLMPEGLALKVLPEPLEQAPFFHWVTEANQDLIPSLEARLIQLLTTPAE